MIGLWHEASHRLQKHSRSSAMIGAARLIAGILCILAGTVTQNLLRANGILNGGIHAALNIGDLFLLGALLIAALAMTPLRMQCDWQLGVLSGILDENDNGFLQCSRNFWLWGKAFAVRLLAGVLTLCAVLPMLLLYLAAKCIWLMIPPTDEGLLPLLTVLHLGFLAVTAVYLPLRMAAARTALPYCYLKAPHDSPLRIIRQALRLTRRQTAAILLLRVTMLPLLLFPFTAVRALPVLLTAEQLRTAKAWRHLQPQRSSRFAHLELHAYERGML